MLVVDDDAALVRMVRLTLLSEGFAVTTAEDGISALQCIAAGSFDVVLLDLQMPRMDGRTFFREMRARGVQTPVLILSAYGAESAQKELAAEGAVTKPFDPDLLIAEVWRMVAAHSPQRA